MCQVRACWRDARIAQSANRRRRAEKAHVTARSAILHGARMYANPAAPPAHPAVEERAVRTGDEADFIALDRSRKVCDLFPVPRPVRVADRFPARRP